MQKIIANKNSKICIKKKKELTIIIQEKINKKRIYYYNGFCLFGFSFEG